MTKLDYETMKRVSHVLHDAGYPAAAAYVFTWSMMPEYLRNDHTPGQERFHHAPPAREPEFGWEGVAERLKKVEDRLAMHVIAAEDIKALHGRIDKVAEIIGERVSGLVESAADVEARLAYVEKWAWGGERRAPAPVDDYEAGGATWQAVEEGGVSFPTGGASTAEAATDAVLPVPQRGDRVRLEGARSVVGSVIADGWYDVLGFAGAPDNPQFQIRVRDADLGMQGIDTPAYSPWLFCGQPSLKEVTRNAST